MALGGRDLVSRHSTDLPAQVDHWVANLDTSVPHFENHRLEALWLLNALNQPLPPLANDLLAAVSALNYATAHDARAEEIRVLRERVQALASSLTSTQMPVLLRSAGGTRDVSTPMNTGTMNLPWRAAALASILHHFESA